MTGKMLRIAIIIVSGVGHTACAAKDRSDNVIGNSVQREEVMPPGNQAKETVVVVRLEDSAAARDFAAFLPLRLTLKDYASTEKIADLPRALSIAGAPEGVTPRAGDVAYYAPWGNLAVFYRDGRYSPGLVRLGRVEAADKQLAALQGPVIIRPADPGHRTTPSDQ